MRAEKKFEVVTQMGNQGHTSAASVQFRQMVERGVVRDITKVEAWKSPGPVLHERRGAVRGVPRGGGDSRDPGLGSVVRASGDEAVQLQVPSLRLASFWLYGNGMLGDWGAHIIDFVHDFLELGQPTRLTPLLIDDPTTFSFP